MTALCYFRRSYTTFDGYILLLAAIYYFRRLYTTFDGYIPHSTAIYYFRRLYTTFSFTLLYFARIQVFPEISFLCELNARLEFNINLLALIEFSFWKRCFIRNTELKMWNFQTLKKTDLDIFNWIKPCYSNCNVP